MVQPVSPNDVKKAHAEGVNIPPQVVEVVNELITKSWNGSSATVYQEDIVKALSGVWTSKELLDNKYLDFEELFRSQGWKVEYDSPSYGDNHFKSYFRFSEKATRDVLI